MSLYTFKSDRLGFRNWQTTDIVKMTAINSDKEVMAFLPSTYGEERTRNFVMRMQSQFDEKGFCYFAVDKLEDAELIGFIGLSEQTYEADFTPCIDIGWRLAKQEWNKGFATEGAKRCIEFGFNDLNLPEIFSVAAVVNVKSVHVMNKIGMHQVKYFNHPQLLNNDELRKCVLYKIQSR